MLHPQAAPSPDAQDGPSTVALRVLQLLLPELPPKTAARLAAHITGASKNALYDAALALKAHNA